MSIFRKTIKYSKPSTEIDNKIESLNQGIEKIKSTLPESNFSDEKIEEILNENFVDVQNWREIFDEETVSNCDQQINEIRERHNNLVNVQGSIEYVKNKEVKKIFNELYQGEVEKVVETYISKYSNQIVELREDLFHEVKKKPNVNIKVLEDKINFLTLKYNELSEGLLNEPNTEIESSITFEQLKNHYQLLVGRLQEQLATVGGGGEVRLQYLDDIVGIATNAAAYDGKFLKYNHSLKKFEFVTVSGGGGGGISLTDLSVTTNSAGTAALSYNNGVFTYTPPSFVGYATEGYVDNAVVGFITSGSSGAGLTALTGASAGTYGDANTTPVIAVDANGRISGISTVSTASGFGGGGISLTDLSVTTNPVGTAALSYNNSNGVFTYTPPSFVGYATEGYVNNAIVGFITSGSLTGYATEGYVDNAIVGFITSGSLTGYATEGYVDNAVASTNKITQGNTSAEVVDTAGSDGHFKVLTEGTERLRISSTGIVTFTGNVTFDETHATDSVTFTGTNYNMAWKRTGDYLQFDNNAKAYFGSGNNTLLISSNGTDGSIKYSGSGVLYIQANGGQVKVTGTNGNEDIANFIPNDAVELYYDNSKKFETTGYGVTVFGTTQTQQLNVTGVSTFGSHVDLGDNDKLRFGDDEDLKIFHSSISNGSVIQNETGNLDIINDSDDLDIVLWADNGSGSHTVYARADGSAGEMQLYHYGTQKLATKSTGVVVTGILTATSFSGNGNDIVHSTWTLGANGSSHYTFTGPGGLNNTDDPKIYLARGQTYEFVNNSGGSHPFQIQQSNGTAYSTGVTNNNASSGTIRFEVPFSAPNTLQYKCTNHGSMGNTIIIYPDLSP